jgi:anthranilate phosphoribosyltransferase
MRSLLPILANFILRSSLGFLHSSATPSRCTMAASASASAASLKPYIETLIAGDRHLTSEETEQAFTEILKGADEVQVGSLLTLLRARGETPTEIAGMVRAMNQACQTVSVPGKLLDIVGTGGDGADTINISTASVVLAAAAGCVVAKIGNRSVSSACGSADVLEALGVKVDLTPRQVEECVEKVGIAFMFAPTHHSSMKHVAPVRKKLGVRTCFNILGPMTNPAGAQHAVIGVFHPELVSLVAGTLKQVGRVDHAVIIHGCGLDEISPLGPSTIIEIRNTAAPGEHKVYEQHEFEFDPLSVGIERCVIEDLKGGGPDENARKFREVLLGSQANNAKRDAIILNAGFGCYVYGLTSTIEDGIKLARETLDSGKAAEKLEAWIDASIATGALIK